MSETSHLISNFGFGVMVLMLIVTIWYARMKKKGKHMNDFVVFGGFGVICIIAIAWIIKTMKNTFFF